MVTDIEKLFPRLVGRQYQVTSPPDEVYNCIAWAAGCTTDWWWPIDLPGNFWPAGADKAETLPAFQGVFAGLGYSVCPDEHLENGFAKIAIFADDQGIPTHASRQLPDGRWTSKLGKLEDTEHDLLNLTGLEYGAVTIIMRRPLP